LISIAEIKLRIHPNGVSLGHDRSGHKTTEGYKTAKGIIAAKESHIRLGQ
jgi:hypothetical protein